MTMILGNHNGRQVASITQVCNLIGVSRRTVYNWMEKGNIDWVTTPSGNRRVYVDTLFKKGGSTCHSTTTSAQAAAE